MGSKISLELKEGHHCLEIDKSLVESFQFIEKKVNKERNKKIPSRCQESEDRIFTTDKAMSSFVKAIDSTEVACEELLRRMRAPGNSNIETKKEVELTDKQHAANLLWTIKECVSDHKFVVLECLSKLMKFIIDTGREYIDDVPDLSIDNYRISHNVEATPYYDTRTEMLQKEIDLLEKKLKEHEEKAVIFNTKELNFSIQQDKYLNRVDELEKSIDTLSNDKTELDERLHKANRKLEAHGIALEERETIESCPLFLEVKFDKLMREIQIKEKMHEMEKDKVDVLNERERINSKEKEGYLRRIKELGNDVDTFVSMNNGLNDKLTDALEQLEGQSIEINFLKRQEKILKENYKQMENETGEYRTKIDHFFDETSHLVEDITQKCEKSKQNMDGSRGYDDESNVDIGARHTYDTENDIILLDKTDVQMEEIRHYLTNVRDKIRKNHDAKGETSNTEKIGDDMKQESGIGEKRIETSTLQAEILLLQQELKSLKEKRIMHVQVYAEYGMKACVNGELDFLKVLENSMSVCSVELRIHEVKSTTVAMPGIPLLILYTLTKKTALVTFHRREKDNIEKSGVLEKHLQRLGGSYDFCLRKNSSDYVFDERTLNTVMEFIQNNNQCGIETIENK